MSSIRTNNSSNESPSKDFANLDDEFVGEPFEMKAIPKDRRVTFGIQDRLDARNKAEAYALRKSASVNFQTGAMEKRLRMMHEN